MLESDPPQNAVTAEQLVPLQNAGTRALRQHPVQLDWHRLIRHPRIEPIVPGLFPDQRRYIRLVVPNVVGYLGRAHASRPHRIADISVGGFCMQGDQYWTPGTEMVITLHREDWDGEESSQHLTIQTTVVRCGPRLTGFSIALVDEKRIASSDAFDEFLRVRRRTMEEFLADT